MRYIFKLGNTDEIAHPRHVQFGHRLTEVETDQGLQMVDDLWEEIKGYTDILLGRLDAPVQSPYLELAEVATAYFARAQEIDMYIHAGERMGDIMKGSPLYKFRTGELRSFIEISRRCAELGSRRLTQETLLHQQRLDYGG
jgi:hypothetical protein